MLRSIEKYLESYADPFAVETAKRLSVQDRSWQKVVVLPFRAEYKDALESLHAINEASHGKKILAVLVVNACTDDEQSVNDKFLAALFPWAQQTKPEVLSATYSENLDLVAFNQRFSLKEGVGLARKIGCDFALALWAHEKVASAWIHTTDADAKVPHGYFDWPECIQAKKGAFVFPFAHDLRDLNPIEREALSFYEESLRYYVRELDRAGSPYAFPTIGSTICFSAEAYAEVRGFPKERLAGEDFYFLDKIAKTSRVQTHPDAPTIILKGRISHRVPFGTGVGMAKNVDLLKKGEKPKVYNSLSFNVLKIWLDALDEFAETTDWKKLTTSLKAQLSDREYEALRPERWEKEWAELGREALSFDRRKARIHGAFDGLKTLQLIHDLRDHAHPDIAYSANPHPSLSL